MGAAGSRGQDPPLDSRGPDPLVELGDLIDGADLDPVAAALLRCVEGAVRQLDQVAWTPGNRELVDVARSEMARVARSISTRKRQC
jgi:hypothetical protein